MKIILLILLSVIAITVKGQRSIVVTVDFVLNDGDSSDVWVRRQHPYRATQVTYFATRFPNPLPDSLQVGRKITLYPKPKNYAGDCGTFKVQK